MPEPEDVMRYAMEDAAWGHYLYAGNELSLASIAISLKRIADGLEKLDPMAPINAYGETIGTCIQGQHERGLRGIPNP
jgi:hypothetical protein